MLTPDNGLGITLGMQKSQTYKCTGNGPATQVDCAFATDSYDDAVAHFEAFDHDVDLIELDPWGTNLAAYETAAKNARRAEDRYRMARTVLDYHAGAGSHPNTIRAWRNRVRNAYSAMVETQS